MASIRSDWGLHLYVILDPRRGLYKIGRSAVPHKRKVNLGGKIMVVVGIVRRGGRHEKAVHRRFKALAVGHEWFKAEGELVAWIASGCDLADLELKAKPKIPKQPKPQKAKKTAKTVKVKPPKPNARSFYAFLRQLRKSFAKR